VTTIFLRAQGSVASVHTAVRLAICLSISAVAAPALAAEAVELDEVTVTAQFREQNVQDTPLAITAVSAEMLEDRSQTNITEVANQAPSVTLKPQGAAWGPSIAAYIRGIGAYDFNPALEPGVGLYVDDVYISTLTGSMLDLLDLDRVEILRGPQGTLAGRNSIGGAVKLYTKRPTEDSSGYFQVTYGSRDRVDLRGSANFALADNLFMRISGVDRKQDGYVKRIDYGCANPGNPYGILSNVATTAGCVVARDSNVNYSAARVALRWVANDRAEFNLSMDYTNDRRNPTGTVLLGYRDDLLSAASRERIQPVLDSNPANNAPASAFVPTERHPYYNYASYYNPPYAGGGSATGGSVPTPWQETRPVPVQFFEGWGSALEADVDLTDSLQVKSITAYRAYQSGFSNDNDLSPLAASIGEGELPFRAFSQELRLNGSTGPVEWTLGGYYLDQRSRYQSLQDLRYAQPLLFQQDDVVNVETKAAFGHLQYRLTEQLQLIAGVRYTDEHKDYNYVRLNRDGTPNPPVVGTLNTTVGVFDGSNTDYRAAVQYSFTDDVMGYVQYATGFKGGGVSPRPFVADQATGFGPESLKTWEAGVKADLLDRRLRVNSAVFFGDYTDIQLGLQVCTGSTLPSPCGRIGNVGTGELKGFEMEAVALVFGGLSVDASYSYTDFKYKSLTGASASILPSFTLPYMPKNKASIGAMYEVGLANGSTITPRVDWSFQSVIYTNGNNQPTNRIGGYGLVNARMVWRNEDGTLDVSLEGTNLMDKYYFQSRLDQVASGGRHTDGTPGRPREFAMTIKKRF
jgi:iron complex outermembrane receptor protein